MRTIGKLAVLLALVALIPGCAQRRQAQEGKKPSLTIAVVPKATSAEFWLTVKAGAEAAGKENGAKIIWRGPPKETDVAGQMAIIENFINQKVDAIVMAACDSKALIPTVEKAIKAGITVVTIDSGIDSDIAVSFVATDNVQGARKAADELARLIGDKGEVGLIPFVPGSATCTMREHGFKEGLSKHPNIKLVATLYSQSDVSRAIAVTEDMLTAHPKIAGIFAANEGGAVGCSRAMEQRKLSGKVKLVAFDAAPAEIDALKRGTIQALIVQNPFNMGCEGVKAAVAAKSGRKVDKRIDTGVTVVTKKNFDQPAIQKLLFPLKN